MTTKPCKGIWTDLPCHFGGNVPIDAIGNDEFCPDCYTIGEDLALEESQSEPLNPDQPDYESEELDEYDPHQDNRNDDYDEDYERMRDWERETYGEEMNF